MLYWIRQQNNTVVFLVMLVNAYTSGMKSFDIPQKSYNDEYVCKIRFKLYNEHHNQKVQ